MPLIAIIGLALYTCVMLPAARKELTTENEGNQKIVIRRTAR